MATQNEVANHLGLSRATVSIRLRDGIFPPAKGPGGLDLDACRMAELGYLRGIKSGTVADKSAEFDQQKERARLTHHQANISALEEDQLRGRLLDAEEVSDAWAGVISNFRAKIMALPMKLAAKLPGVDQSEVVRVSRKLSNDALDELAAYEIPEIKRGDPDGEVAA